MKDLDPKNLCTNTHEKHNEIQLRYEGYLYSLYRNLDTSLIDFFLTQKVGGESFNRGENIEFFYDFLKETYLFGILQENLKKMKDNIGEKAIRNIFKVCLLKYYKSYRNRMPKIVERDDKALGKIRYLEKGGTKLDSFEKELAKMENAGNYRKDLDNGFNYEELSSIFSSLNENPNKVFEDLYERGENGKYQIYKNIKELIYADKSLNTENKRKLSEIIEEFMYKYPENCLFIKDYLSDLPF